MKTDASRAKQSLGLSLLRQYYVHAMRSRTNGQFLARTKSIFNIARKGNGTYAYSRKIATDLNDNAKHVKHRHSCSAPLEMKGQENKASLADRTILCTWP
jgi:hypothetical protein